MIKYNDLSICENCFAETTTDVCPVCGYRTGTISDNQLLPPGSILAGKYIVGKALGVGGFGVTYLGFHVNEKKTVAIKEYFPKILVNRRYGDTTVMLSNRNQTENLEKGRTAFYNEAQILAQFRGNDNIVGVHEFFFENNTAYFVMEYLEGKDLRAYLTGRGKVLSSEETKDMMIQIASALNVTHSMDVLHRDVSNVNIFVCEGKTRSYKLIDFGAARQVSSERTQSMSVILNPGFAPLEQYQRHGKQGPWTDIYALGATAYWALTGQLLDDPMTRLNGDHLVNISGSDINPRLYRIICKCISVEPKNRYQDTTALLKDLKGTGMIVNWKKVAIAGTAAVVIGGAAIGTGVLLSGMGEREDESHNTGYQQTLIIPETGAGLIGTVPTETEPVSEKVDALYEKAVKAYESQNYGEAFDLFVEAADEGHVEAMYRVYDCYADGVGTDRNNEKALQYLEMAGKHGHFEALPLLAEVYRDGEGGVTPNLLVAEEWATLAMNREHPDGAELLGSIGELYYDGDYQTEGGLSISKDAADKKAFELFTAAATGTSPDARSAYMLGLCYEEGRGTEADVVKALEWFREAKTMGDSSAEAGVNRILTVKAYAAGINYYEAKEYNKAFPCFRLAADEGEVADAMYYMAESYAKGQGVTKDATIAFQYYEKAAGKRHGKAALAVADGYAKGQGTGKDETKALNYYKKALQYGEKSALVSIGAAYYNGTGTAVDYAKAYDYYKQAYDEGQPNVKQYIDGAALLKYAGEYYGGKGKVAKNEANAFRFYKLAAEAGETVAMNWTAYLYKNGQGTTKNLNEAFQWYKKAADKNYDVAMYNTAMCYINGEGTARDYEKAYEYHSKAFKAGYEASEQYTTPAYMYQIGVYYYNGNVVTQDYAKAVKWFKKSADEGHTEAVYQLGVCHYQGYGTAQDFAKAVEQFRKAAGEKHSGAYRMLGLCYENGQGVSANYYTALEWLNKAKAAGYSVDGDINRVNGKIAAASQPAVPQETTKPETEKPTPETTPAKPTTTPTAEDKAKAKEYYNKGENYYFGNGVTRDYKKAYENYLKAAELGHDEGMRSVGYMLQKGYGVEVDYLQAMQWYLKAAELGNSTAMNDVGYLYSNGLGVKADKEKAVSWYKLAALAGNEMSMVNLGRHYDNLETPDYKEAVKWYTMAAEAGNMDGMYELAICYRGGYGVAQNYPVAMKWYKKAAEQGHDEAMLAVGYMYDEGLGVPVDGSEALEWYKKAAELGNSGAMNNIAFMYEHGEKLKKDLLMAVSWYKKAADLGNTTAMYNLGWIYYEGGEGVKQNYATSYNWFMKSSEGGKASAMYIIGQFYEFGIHVSQDYQKALEWYRLARDAGDPDAEVAIIKIKEKIREQ